MKVRNMESPRTGKPVSNQFIIEDGDVVYFQSYETVIAKKENSQVTLDEKAWDYSVTTSKYRNQFLNCDTKTVKSRIADGTYKLDNLN